jgi:hypothetical protein
MPIPASGAGPGDRFFTTLAKQFTRFYLRHKTEIDNNLSSLLIDALMSIVTANTPGGEISDMNVPGPE